MCPSNGTETTGLVNEFGDFGSPTFDDNCFPTCIADLFPTDSPSSMLLFADDVTVALATGCHDDDNNNNNARQLEGGLPTPLSQPKPSEEKACLDAFIPLTVLEIDVEECDDVANASPERTFLPANDVMVTSRSVPASRKRGSGGGGGVRQRSLDSSDGPRGTKARKLSVPSPQESSLLFGGTGNAEAAYGRSFFTGQVCNDLVTMNGDSGRRLQLELRDERNATPLNMLYCQGNSGNQVATEPLTETSSVTSSVVPHFKLDRRREQNRKAANRCRHKRKLEEDQLKKDFESTEKDNLVKQREIQNLLYQIKHLETELHRHASSDHCYVIHQTLNNH